MRTGSDAGSKNPDYWTDAHTDLSLLGTDYFVGFVMAVNRGEQSMMLRIGVICQEKELDHCKEREPTKSGNNLNRLVFISAVHESEIWKVFCLICPQSMRN